MYSYGGNAEFSAFLLVTWSFRNHSDMLMCCLRNIYYQCWKHLCWIIC